MNTRPFFNHKNTTAGASHRGGGAVHAAGLLAGLLLAMAWPQAQAAEEGIEILPRPMGRSMVLPVAPAAKGGAPVAPQVAAQVVAALPVAEAKPVASTAVAEAKPVASTAVAAATQWEVKASDITLAKTIERWTNAAGYKLKWDASRNFLIGAPDVYTGSFEFALQSVLSSSGIRLSDYPLEACIYANTPPLVRITRQGEQARECSVATVEQP